MRCSEWNFDSKRQRKILGNYTNSCDLIFSEIQVDRTLKMQSLEINVSIPWSQSHAKNVTSQNFISVIHKKFTLYHSSIKNPFSITNKLKVPHKSSSPTIVECMSVVYLTIILQTQKKNLFWFFTLLYFMYVTCLKKKSSSYSLLDEKNFSVFFII